MKLYSQSNIAKSYFLNQLSETVGICGLPGWNREANGTPGEIDAGQPVAKSVERWQQQFW